MKKIFAFFAVAALFAGCQKDIVDDTPVETTLSAPLTLAVGESTTRAFDDELKWSWENSDVIVGYQNADAKTRNTLSLKEGNKFHCNEFAYSTDAAADFHFFYANETTEGELTAVQDGTWRPVLVGTARNTTLDAIETVGMNHLSAALEVRVWKGTEQNHEARNVTAAKLSSESDFIGKWSVDNNLAYTQSLDGKEISLTGLDTSTVVFNMPVGTFADDALKLTFTHNGYNHEYLLPAQTFVAGKRNLINITLPKIAYLPMGGTIRDAILDDATSVKFVVNSDVVDGDNLADGGAYPIYKVVNGTEIEFHTSADKFMANAYCSGMFDRMGNLQEIDFTNVDTSNVTTMSSMFYACYNLTSLTFGDNFDTSNVTDMSNMFSNCYALTSLDLSGFNTAKVTNMSFMFFECEKLILLNVSGFNTAKVTNMYNMFYRCEQLTTLDVSGFNTANVTNMTSMFHKCYNLTSLNVSGFNTANVTNMTYMFAYCKNLTLLNVSGFNTEKVTNMDHMFSNCIKLTSLDVSGFNTANVTSMNSVFIECNALETLKIGSNFKTNNVTTMENMFYNCNTLTSLDLTNFSFEKGPELGSIFYFVGSSLTGGKKTQIYVSADGWDYLKDKYLGYGKDTTYVIVGPTNNQ
ncbi:MAG: BspA family leucine-rich repeat surface protein [Alistipes sp.]|nr:BspA family leucine-rich repeat surface protein [Alistipes sp.]